MTSLRWLKKVPKHGGKIKAFVFLCSLLPLIILLVEYFQGNLGFDPLDRIIRLTGFAAITQLIASLSITPLRHFLTWCAVSIKADYGKRTSDWNWIIKPRRMIGVFSSFYALLHLSIYFWLDQGADIAETLLDIYDRPFILMGMAAFILLIPVTVTSTNYMMRQLGKNWRRVHRLVYPISVLAILHFSMLTKVGVFKPYLYMAVVILLLGWRVWFSLEKLPGKIPDDGLETPQRGI